MPSLPVSAMSECILQDMNRNNDIEYHCGSPVYVEVSHEVSSQLEKIQQSVFDR